MLILFLIIFVGIIALSSYGECHWNWDGLYMLSMIIGVVGLVVVGVGIFCCAIDVSYLNVVDDRIAMYTEENTKIEQRIATTVEQYQQYETDIFKEVAPKDAVTMVALYPELKSDTLVQQQIEVYVANNEKIKELREYKIEGKVTRWWLYFG